MSAARLFTVLTTGEIEPGFDETQVALDFVSLINTTPERAVAFIHTEQKLIVDVDEARANAYQKRLADIGMRIRVVDSEELAAANETDAQQQQDAADSGGLSLEAVSMPADEDSAVEETIGEINHISLSQKTPTEADESTQEDSKQSSSTDSESIAQDTEQSSSANDESNTQNTEQSSSTDDESITQDTTLSSSADDESNSPDAEQNPNATEELTQTDAGQRSDTSEAFAQVDTEHNPSTAVHDDAETSDVGEVQSLTSDNSSNEQDIIDGIREAGNIEENAAPQTPFFSFRNRSFRLLILAFISAVLVSYIQLTSTTDRVAEAIRSVAPYQVENTASGDMNQLMEMSGMKADVNRFSLSMTNRFGDSFSETTGSSSELPERRFNELMGLVPKAYNEKALNNTISSWLQKNTFDDDIPALTEAYSLPEVQAYIETKQTKNRTSDLPGFQSYQESLADNPIKAARNRELTRLLDALILDKVSYEIEGDAQRAVITTRGAVGPDSDSTAVKERVRKELKQMRDELVYSRPTIRRDALHELSWQLEEFSVEDIRVIRSSLDDSSVRELKRQMVKGYEDYLKLSTLWLQRKL